MAEVTAGTLLGGRYRLQQPLARGGMASVWIGEDETLARRVAVKVLDAHLAADQALRTRFRREAIAAAGLAHPGIVATYDTGDDQGVAYIVMEYVEGPTLRSLIEHRSPLPISFACDVAAQTAEALDFAHRHGIVHRDVKPGNVIVREDGRAKVTDFGIAKAAGEGDLTRTGTVVGTARYLAPEQVEGLPVDARADVYALGLVCFEMLTGQPAFQADSEIATAVARLHRDPPRADALRPEVPTAIADAIERATRRAAADRTPSAAAFHDELAPFAGRDTLDRLPEAALVSTGSHEAAPHTVAMTRAEPPAPPPLAAPAPRSAAAWVWLVGLVLFAAGVAAGFFVTRALLDDDSAAGVPASTSSAPVGPLAIVSAQDYDPEGGDGENPDDVRLAYDGDPATAWRTERYFSRDLGGGKSGVGIVFDLGKTEPIRTVEVETGEAGWSGALYASEELGSTLAAWGPPIRAEQTDLPQNTSFTVDGEGRYLLVWVTYLPESGRFELNEIRVSS